MPSDQYRSALVELLGYSTDERELIGITSDRRGDGSVIGLGHSGRKYGDANTQEAARWSGWGTALKPAHEPIVMARKPLVGTVAANVLEWGVGGINVDGCRVEHDAGVRLDAVQRQSEVSTFQGAGAGHVQPTYSAAGRFPANVLHDGSDEVVALFPETKSGSGKRKPNDHEHGWGFKADDYEREGDSGSAARFFYSAKASRDDRAHGLDDSNHHPTVKPTDVMRWLVRMVTPPGGLVLDPFTGSGSTGRAAMLEGMRFVGCELSEEYAGIARSRIAAAIKLARIPEHRRTKAMRKVVVDERQGGLFA